MKRITFIFIILFGFLLLRPPLIYAVATTRVKVKGGATVKSWWNTSWQNRRKITFNASSTTALTNFPVLITLNSSTIEYAQTNASGSDIRFIDSNDKTILNHELEVWATNASTSATSTLWVQKPTLQAGPSDFIYMYYNNPTAVDGSHASATWDSNFKAVWHLKNSPGFPATSTDSTSNGNNGTATTVASSTGQIDGGASFNGSSGNISNGSGASLANLGAITASAWINPTTATNNNRIFNKSTVTFPVTAGWVFTLDSTDATKSLQFSVAHATTNLNRVSAAGAISNITWQHVSVTWDGSTTAANSHIYINGTETGSYTITTNAVGSRSDDTTTAVLLGNTQAANRTFDGTIDDARISNIVRSTDWVYNEYATAANLMNTFAAAESAPASNNKATANFFIRGKKVKIRGR